MTDFKEIVLGCLRVLWDLAPGFALAATIVLITVLAQRPVGR